MQGAAEDAHRTATELQIRLEGNSQDAEAILALEHDLEAAQAAQAQLQAQLEGAEDAAVERLASLRDELQREV